MDLILDYDTWLLMVINGAHNDYLDVFMRLFSGRLIWVAMYISIAAVMIWRFGWKRGLIILIAAGVAVGASDFLCASVIRPLVQRLRPSNLDNPISDMVHIVNGYRSGAYGFPSCHAANTFALAVFTAMVIRHPRYSVFIFIWAALQCYSRIYLGVHYPGDILVGALIGTAIAMLVYWVAFRRISLTIDVNYRATVTPITVVGAITIFVLLMLTYFPMLLAYVPWLK